MSTSNLNNTVFSKNESVRTFQEYLRIPSVQPNIDYSKYSVHVEEKFNYNMSSVLELYEHHKGFPIYFR